MKVTKTNFVLGELLALVCILIQSACSESLSDPDVVEQEDLEAMFKQISVLSESMTCVDEAEWSITAIGNKSCGGPAGYIAYSIQIDTVDFLNKVEDYTGAQRKYNMDNGIISDCSIVPIPLGIKCQEEKPSLVYDRCELPPNSGPCEAAITIYYFDQQTKTCKEFLWGGCDGVVPFETLEECQECLKN